jgi:hypothetical protein
MASSGDETRAVRVGTCTKAEAADPSGIAATAAASGTNLKKNDNMAAADQDDCRRTDDHHRRGEPYNP